MNLLLRVIDSVHLDIWLLLSAVFLIAVAIIVMASAKKKDPPVVQEITLRDLSVLWTKKGAKTIHISELSPLWRDEKVIAEKDLKLPEVKNSRAAAFMEQYIRQGEWFKKAPLQKAICGQIVKILDQEGDCPSVVNLKGDVEASWDENTYQLLSRVSLLDHSLNVAELVVRLLTENESLHVIPDAMIAALGHDLGKLDSLRSYLYSLGEHPLTAGRCLEGIPGYEDLPKKDEISRAIRLHHKMADGLLGKTLKKADQQARQIELEEVGPKYKSMPETTSEKLPDSTSRLNPANEEETTAPEPERQDTIANAAAAWQAQADIYGETNDAAQKKSTGDVPKLIDISAWFDVKAFLDELKPYINKMFGRRFLAFSMSEGYVYFQTKVLEEVARKQSERAGCMEIATMAQRDPTMRQVLFTIVHHLRSENDIIARGLIKDNFFGGYFMVTKRIGKNLKGYYTPFHAEAFGSIGEMEQGKSDTLRNIQKVEPFVEDGFSE